MALLLLAKVLLMSATFRSGYQWFPSNLHFTTLAATTVHRGGTYGPSEQHTTIFPHKTDACALCVLFSSDVARAEQSLKRHKQQADQGTLSRISAIVAVEQQRKDAAAELDRHRKESSAAMEMYKARVQKAPADYSALCQKYTAFMELGQSATTADIEAMADAACSLRFDVISDYQQDKHIPAWNLSPQPGPTYFMSAGTHFVHIICFDSCGEASGSHRHSRNLVYTRSEEVSGSNMSDDTLSTLGDALLGSPGPNYPHSYLVRSGYDVDGKIE